MTGVGLGSGVRQSGTGSYESLKRDDWFRGGLLAGGPCRLSQNIQRKKRGERGKKGEFLLQLMLYSTALQRCRSPGGGSFFFRPTARLDIRLQDDLCGNAVAALPAALVS